MIRKALMLLFLSLCVGLTVRGFTIRSMGADALLDAVPEHLDFEIQETAEARGLKFTHQNLVIPGNVNIKPWIQAFGAAVAVDDVNGDGFMDIYMVNTRPTSQNALFVNQKDGTFKEAAAQYGLADLNQDQLSVRPLFFDCNNDGRKDLLLTTQLCPQVYRQNEKGKFDRMAPPSSTEGCSLSEAVAIYDFNKDGFLDVVAGGINGDSQSFRTVPMNFVNARNGADLAVFLNNGKCELSNAKDILNPGGRFFYHSIGFGDLRGTGQQDMWASTDFNSDKIFLNQNGKFDLTAIEGTNSRYGMNTEFIYLKGDQNPFVFVTHTFRMGYVMGGNTLWQYKDGQFRDHAIAMGLRRCGWAWGGRAIDLNNDGLLDIAVANGYYSADPQKDYWYSFSVIGATASMISSNANLWPDMNGKNFSGYERDCLFVNQGDHFVDVGAKVDFDSARLDGRGVAVIDADNSGVQNILVANQSGRLHYYSVKPKANHAWIGFKLESRRGVREALGAKVVIQAGGKTFRRELFTANTYSAQSEPRLHFGLGDVKSIESVEVQWPSGKISKLGTLPLNRYHYVVED